MTPDRVEASDHVDVLIVGAGISGIGAACQLRRHRPGTTFTVLESREAIGGTWDLFRYPGVRSDSDMFTLGYSFRPWTGERAIADGASIRRYVQDVAAEHAVTEAVRFGHRVVRADFSTQTALWTVQVERTGEAGERQLTALTCRFLFAGTGYYRYDEGYTPDLPGIEEFSGRVVHPQHWPADLEVTGARVVVIGSGATAVTLVPALAQDAAHVTMLQRSPSWLLSLRSRDGLADALRGTVPPRLSAPLVRWRNLLRAMILFQLSRRRPAMIRKLLRKGVVAQLPSGYDVDTDFTPSYDPWDQRLCFVPDGDFFRAVRSGRASVTTDRIATFTPTGVELASGRHLDADVVVTATGLRLQLFGGIAVSVDGHGVDLSEAVTYKGLMLSGVPNFAFVMGYTNASWTLKVDLVTRYVCRLLDHLDAHGRAIATPAQPPTPQRAPLLDLSAGYVQRGLDQLPKQGAKAPWRSYQNYLLDLLLLRLLPVADAGVRFSSAGARGDGVHAASARTVSAVPSRKASA